MSALLAPDLPVLVSEEPFFEIVDGERVEVEPMSFFSNFVANRFSQEIAAFVRGKNLGFSVVKCLFRMNLPVMRMRRPDFAFVSSERWPMDKPFPEEGNVLDVVPDLMGEVVSPSDLAEELLDKVHEYFQSGATQIWIVYPKRAVLQVFEGPATSRWLGRDDVIENLPFLPGFRLPLVDIFGPQRKDA